MKNKLLLGTSLLFSGFFGNAQKPAEWLTNWSEKSPVEKVYLHFDRDNYVAGETAWFKAYLYSDFYPDTISTTLYTELLNASSVSVAIKATPVVAATSKCQFELPDTLPSGNYFVRAYTLTMLNHGDEFLFQRSIYINGKKDDALTITGKKITRIEFFPESGNFVSGLLNTIAFKITDENGLPLDVQGMVKSENGDSIAAVNCYHAGMGSFDITPAKDSKYYVLLKDDPTLTKYYLPVATPSGIVFRLTPFAQGRRFEIYQQPGNPALKPAYIIGQMQHHVVFNMKLNGEKNYIDASVRTPELNSGILQVTVFNNDGMPLAERLSFIDNKEYLQKAELVTDTISFSEKGRNHFTLAFPDSVNGSFSMAITDPDYSTEATRKENIISSLLLTSDLKGYVHDPHYYFSADTDSARIAGDILMMTHGWRRFRWAELAAVSAAPLRYHDPGFITITGNINQRDTKKPLVQKDLFVMLSQIDDSLSSSMQFVVTDDQGKFRMDSLIFFNKNRFYISDLGGKKSKWLDIYPDRDSINTSFSLRQLNSQQFILPEPVTLATIASRLAYDYESILKAKGEMLEEVIVKVRKKTPVQELEEKYTSGLFASFSQKTIDLVHTNEKIYQRNIFDYIQSRVPGINVRKNGIDDYVLIYRNRSSISQGFIPMQIYLDEIETDARIVATIPADQIAMIKVFSNFHGGSGDGSAGALAVYTKKGADLTSSLRTGADVFLYKGYSIIKEFYSPDYSVTQNASTAKKDERITLHWQDIEFAGVNTKVPVIFYNNERSKSFKIIAEGMTADGKLLFIEKIVTPATKGF